MVIKTLDPSFCLEVISKYENVLEKQKKERDHYFSRLFCVKCGNNNVDSIPVFSSEDGTTAIVEGYLPKQMAKCKKCMCEFEPYTKLITKEK